ncbi:MAG: hypothetical protein AB7F20_10320 [Geoalkalibacter sp.]|uniref:hypothetical protein n=1 Tax=Geoalkalibacter sp. TaxID=3041440 RepID=UPI003D10B328
MKLKVGKIILAAPVVLIVLWLLGRATLTVQLPDRVELDLFAAPTDQSFTLREAFDELSEGDGLLIPTKNGSEESRYCQFELTIL